MKDEELPVAAMAAEPKISKDDVKEKLPSTDKAPTIADETWNGAVTDNYTWSQTLTDLDVRVIVPKGTTAKDLKIDITTSHLKVVLLNTRDPDNPGPHTIIEGEFARKVIPSQSMWSIEKATSVVHINLEKPQEVMWKSVLKGDAEIDLTKVDTTKNITEFDPDTQAAIHRVQYDHHQKLQGKPTSQQKVSISCIVVNFWAFINFSCEVFDSVNTSALEPFTKTCVYLVRWPFYRNYISWILWTDFHRVVCNQAL